MLSMRSANLRSRAFALSNIAKIVFKFLKLRKNNILSNITHTARKRSVQNINRSRAQMNQRPGLRINLCFHHVHKRADIVLGFFLFSVNFLRVNRRRNVIKIFRSLFIKLAANLQMSLYQSRLAFCARTDAGLFRNILRKPGKHLSFRQRISMIDTRKIFKNITCFHKNIIKNCRNNNNFQKFRTLRFHPAANPTRLLHSSRKPAFQSPLTLGLAALACLRHSSTPA